MHITCKNYNKSQHAQTILGNITFMQPYSNMPKKKERQVGKK
jgi:hypothetical protein